MLNTQSINCHRIPAIAASVLVISSVLLSFGGGLTCQFLRINFNDPHLDDEVIIADAPNAPPPEDIALVDEHDMMGIFCPSPYHSVDYDSGELDRMVQVSRAFLILALAFGLVAAVTCLSVTVLITPTTFNWRVISLLTALSAVCQVPVFLLFETHVCTGRAAVGMSDHDIRAEKAVYWNCEAYRGCFVVIASTLGYLAATLVTQCTDPPRWTHVRDSWKVSSVDSDHIDDIPLCDDKNDGSSREKSRGLSSQLDRSNYAPADRLETHLRQKVVEAMTPPSFLETGSGLEYFTDEDGVIGAHRVEVGPTGVEVGPTGVEVGAMRVEGPPPDGHISAENIVLRGEGAIQRQHQQVQATDRKMRLSHVLALGASRRGSRTYAGPVDLDESLPGSSVQSDVESQRYGILPPPLSPNDPNYRKSAHSLSFLRFFTSGNSSATSGSDESNDLYSIDWRSSRLELRPESAENRYSQSFSDETDEVVTTKSTTRTGTSATSIIAGYVSYVLPHSLHHSSRRGDSENSSVDPLTSEDDKTPPAENKNVKPACSSQGGTANLQIMLTARNTGADEADERTSPTRDSDLSSPDEGEAELLGDPHDAAGLESKALVTSSDASSSESGEEKKQQRCRLRAARGRSKRSARKGPISLESVSMDCERRTNASETEPSETQVYQNIEDDLCANGANTGVDSTELENVDATRSQTLDVTLPAVEDRVHESHGGADASIMLTDPEFFISTKERRHSHGVVVTEGDHRKKDDSTSKNGADNSQVEGAVTADDAWVDPLDTGDVLTTVVASVGEGINLMASSIRYATGGWMIDDDEDGGVGRPNASNMGEDGLRDGGTGKDAKSKVKKRRKLKPRPRLVRDVTANPLSATAGIGKKAVGMSRSFSKRQTGYRNMDEYDVETGSVDLEDEISPYKFKMEDKPLLPSLSFNPEKGVSYYHENKGSQNEPKEEERTLQSEGGQITSLSYNDTKPDNLGNENLGESNVVNSHPRFVMSESESHHYDLTCIDNLESGTESKKPGSLRANRRRRRRKKKKAGKGGNSSDGSSVSSGTSLLELTIDEETDQELEEFERDDGDESSRPSSPAPREEVVTAVISASEDEGEDDAPETEAGRKSALSANERPPSVDLAIGKQDKMSVEEGMNVMADELGGPAAVDATASFDSQDHKQAEAPDFADSGGTIDDPDTNRFDYHKSVEDRFFPAIEFESDEVASYCHRQEPTQPIQFEDQASEEFTHMEGPQVSPSLDRTPAPGGKVFPSGGPTSVPVEQEINTMTLNYGPPPPIDSDDDNPEGIFLSNATIHPDNFPTDCKVVTPSPVERQKDLPDSFFCFDVPDDEASQRIGLSDRSAVDKIDITAEDFDRKDSRLEAGESTGIANDAHIKTPHQQTSSGVVPTLHVGCELGSGDDENDAVQETNASAIRNVRVRRLQRQQELMSSSRSLRSGSERPSSTLMS